MELGLPSGSGRSLARRLAWVTGLRLAILIALLAATFVLYLRGDFSRFPQTERVTFATLGSGLGLAAVYAAILRSGRAIRALSFAQIALDQLTWSAIVWVSGGAASGATSFYGLTCLLGAVLIGARGAAVAAATGIGAYALLSTLLALGVLAAPIDVLGLPAYPTSLASTAYPLATNSIGIALVATMAGYLAERLKRTGGALEAASRRAADAERLAVLGRIAAGLAHEIRNPLGSISGSVEMLRESPGLSAEDKQLLAIVAREALRLNDLVTDMMDLARPRAPAPEQTDLTRIAREVCALATHSERSATGDVTVRLEADAGQAVVLADPAQIRQLVWNLVRNAVQVTQAGSVVTLRVRRDPPDVVLEVEDGGPGIPESDRERIFDAFYTTRVSGAGLGLAVVRRVVDDHAALGARIDVRCPENGGAIFSLRLPDRSGSLTAPRSASIRP